MILEEQRYLHEDLERIEQAISDRVAEDPRNIRDRLNRDHQIAGFLERYQERSKRLLDTYKDDDGAREKEIQAIGTGDTFEEFYKQLREIKDFHRRYPNEPVENLEKEYREKPPVQGDFGAMEVDHLFSGEEAHGRFLDLIPFYNQYLNLSGFGSLSARRISYLQYLDIFDSFTPPQCLIKKEHKFTDEYFKYLGDLMFYLENFMRKTKPLEDLVKIFKSFDEDFEQEWQNHNVKGWEEEAIAEDTTTPAAESAAAQFYCDVCQKQFHAEGTYDAHLTAKKHRKNLEAKKAGGGTGGINSNGTAFPAQRLKERAIALREFRIRKLAKAMQTERSDTKVNVERRQGMTERERQQELEALYAESNAPAGSTRPREDGDSDEEGDDKIYNPLKLPLAWDGKPIPYWLYKLHGLGNEFQCEVCGNFVYMGRKAFDKHFNDSRHIYRLKCLGINNPQPYREITKIDDVLALQAKLESDKKAKKAAGDNLVQMEDSEGNVMPEKVYYDLQKQGLV